MIPLDPAVFLHPMDYHGGGVSFFPVVVFVVGVALFAYGAWRLRRAVPVEGAESSERGSSPEETTDSLADR